MKPPRDASRIGNALRKLVQRVAEPFVDVWESNLNDRGSRMMMRVIGAGLLALGIGVAINDWTKHISKRLEPIPNPVLGYADGVGCGTSQGSWYRLSLGDHDYACTGADYTCAREKHVPVIYNKNYPSHCRRADRVGKLSVRDWICATRSPVVLTFGAALVLGQFRDRCRLRRLIAHGALATCILLFLLGTVWSIANGGDMLRFDNLLSPPLTSRVTHG